MASSLIRLRRYLGVLSGIRGSFSETSLSVPVRVQGCGLSSPPPNVSVQSRSFTSSPISLLSVRSSQSNMKTEIDDNTILFEGCDYNHWLFVMDFPKDENKPSPEQMVRTYEETCAKGLNISLEEAKKKMYACSTTTYTGFQAIMTEEESKKFENLPGVVFVLPDSYIDPMNKQYGGDQYIDGTIIPRPPPIQYGRHQGRRERDYRDRRPGQENQMSNPQGSMPRDGRNHGYPPRQNNGQPPPQSQPPQHNYAHPSPNHPPQQNYGQPSHNHPPQPSYRQSSPNYPSQQSYGQPSQNHPPQQNYGQSSQNYPPQQNYGQSSPNYPPQQNYGQSSPNYPPQQSYGQSQNYPPQQRTNASSQQRYNGPASPQNMLLHSSEPFRRDPVPGHGASEARGGTYTPSYMEQSEEGNEFKDNLTEEGRY